MAVEIFKKTTTYPKSSRIGVVKTKLVRVAENYREALQILSDLKAKNTNDNIEFITGDIHR